VIYSRTSAGMPPELGLSGPNTSSATESPSTPVAPVEAGNLSPVGALTALQKERRLAVAAKTERLQRRIKHDGHASHGHVLLTEKQVRAKTALAHTTIHKLRKKGMFCEPIETGTGGVRYIESEIDAWIEAGMAQRNDKAGQR